MHEARRRVTTTSITAVSVSIRSAQLAAKSPEANHVNSGTTYASL